jgi:hypothetical protein
MANLQLHTYIGMQVITPGSAFTLNFHVHQSDGNNFNWTGYTPKARLTVGSVSISVTGTVVTAGAGTATCSWTATQTATLGSNAWGTITLFADPTATTENLFIADIDVQINAEVIP